MDYDLQFLLDTVALTRLTRAQIKSEIVQHHSTVIEEVSYEFRFSSKAYEISSIVDEVSVELLVRAKELLEQPVVQGLLDLYGYEGNGDVLILAKAAVENEKSTGELFRRNWVIVTDDKNLVAAATANGIDTLGIPPFMDLLSAEERVAA